MKLLLIAYFFVLSSICEPCKVGDEYNDQTEASNQAGWYLNVNVPANCSGSISGYKIKYYNINLQASFQYIVNIYIWKPIGGVSYEKDSSTRVLDYFYVSNKRRRKKSTDERTPELPAPVGIRKGSVIGVYLYNFILFAHAAMPVIGSSSNSIINNIPIGVCKPSNNIIATTVDCTNASYYSNLLLHAEADINIVDCGSPPNIDNANFMLLDGDTQYGATVQYNCNIGYILTGNDNITCQLNGSWTTPLLSCNIVDCNDPGTPDNGEVVGSVFTYNASVIFLCGTGYELHGNKTATCQANGQWNIAFPICKIVNCSDPGIPSNGNKIGNAYSYNSSIYYFCDTGYNLTGNNKLTCSANGSWDKSVPMCEIISCDNPGTPSNGYKIGSVYSYNSSVLFSCNAGYNLMGSSILTCLANGSWDGDTPSCYIVDCGDPGTPNNGQRNGLNYTYGSYVTFSCQKGYIISSNVTLQCLTNGNWNGSLPTCTLISCGNPGTPVHGIRHGDSFDFQDVVSFSCESELSLIGNANITCQSNGLWSDSLPMCSHLDCNDPGTPDNGQQHGSNFSYGASISFTCNFGYEISGNSIIECEVEGKWNGTIPTCHITYCNNPGVPVNGSASPSNFTYGSVVTFYCDIGLEVAGSTNIKCQANGIWNDTLPVCTLVTCPNPVPPTNGYIEGSSNTFSSIITFHCHPSYHLEGNTSAQCQANKVWTAIAPTCLKLCNDPGIPNNGSRLPSNPPLLTEGVDFTFDCFAGYRLLGSSSITCLSSGQWSQLTPQCVRVCSDPGTPDHGSQNPKSSFYIEGSVINFQCDNNYELSGATNLTCLSGKWNNVIPQCIGTTFTITDTTKAETVTLVYTPTTSSVLPTDQDEVINKFGVIIGAIMSAFLFVLGLLFIIMLVVLLIWRSHKHSGKLVLNLEDKSHEMSTITNPMMFISELYDSTSPKSLDEATPYEVPVQTLHNQFANKPQNTNLNESNIYTVMEDMEINKREFHKNDIDSDLIENDLSSPQYFALDQCESTDDTSIEGGIPQPLYFTLKGGSQPVYFTLEQTDSNKNMAANIPHQPVYFTLEEPKHITSDQLQGDINQPLYFTLNQKSKRTTLIYQEPCDSEDELYGQIKKSPVASISLDALQLGNVIGSGQFGNVRSAVWLKDDGQNIEVALKTLQEGATKQEKIKFLQEAFIMSQFNHSNVIKLHGVVIDENSPMIVVEYMPKGDLHGVLHKIRPDPGELINSDTPILLLNFCRQICLGMTYLSEKGFVHRDLAARNILVSADNICKIIDFGLSRDLEDENYYVSRKGAMIPVKWTAPEALNYRKYSTASDVWSYGCLMYEIWSLGHKPYENLSNLQALQKICGGYRLPPPPGCSETIYNLMMSCWHPIPRERPSFDDVMLILLQNDETLLTMPEDALSSHPQAGVLGGTLKAGELMYLKIQSKYTDFIDTSL